MLFTLKNTAAGWDMYQERFLIQKIPDTFSMLVA